MPNSAQRYSGPVGLTPDLSNAYRYGSAMASNKFSISFHFVIQGSSGQN